MPVAQTKEPTARHGSEPSGPECWRIELPHAPSAVSLARALTGAALRDLRATADRATAALLAAELVANAVAHTRGPGPVALVVRARAAGCEVEVHDADPTPVVGLLAAACDAERTGRTAGPAAGSPGAAVGQRSPVVGRGLRLVRGLSTAAGCRRTPHGKAVWFTLPALREPRLP
ncbi:ATP-binding protein [Streptomyces yunnanensis]|uniref:ATP-binding protein n=1 Tax=Streptomyces yunnanensis TaxID=156453 RepID=A0ABY8A7K2_9ACTN|nr:ATP-binding protein [Streptomyces yunnanensis]WEB39915.1 ATP-binding protein [Streptomyces yunnanensis]